MIVCSIGCATRGYEKAQATSDAITSASREVELAWAQVSETTNALHALTSKPAAELQPAFEQYRKSIRALEKTVEDLRKKTAEMEQRGQTYFDTWNVRLGEISNEDIRARSAERQREVTGQFAEIQRRYQNAREKFEPLMSNLRDIQAALGIDLTPAGIESARPFINRIDVAANTARTALEELASSLRSLRTRLDPTSAPAPVTTAP
jgi:flagellar biosynthesis chaperone FliJ